MKIYKIAEPEAYHGSETEIVAFDIGFSGNGIDKEGPGIYFTSSKQDALHYGNKIHNVILDLKKTVSTKGRPNVSNIKKLILWACNLQNENELQGIDEERYWEMALSNYGENPCQAFVEAVNSYSTYTQSSHEAFNTISNDFYKNNPIDFIKNMVKLGYDGVIIPRVS